MKADLNKIFTSSKEEPSKLKTQDNFFTSQVDDARLETIEMLQQSTEKFKLKSQEFKKKT